MNQLITTFKMYLLLYLYCISVKKKVKNKLDLSCSRTQLELDHTVGGDVILGSHENLFMTVSVLLQVSRFL